MAHFGTEFTHAMRAEVEQARADLYAGMVPSFAEALAETGGDYEHAVARFAPGLLVQRWPRGAYASALACAVAEVHRLKQQNGDSP